MRKMIAIISIIALWLCSFLQFMEIHSGKHSRVARIANRAHLTLVFYECRVCARLSILKAL